MSVKILNPFRRIVGVGWGEEDPVPTTPPQIILMRFYGEVGFRPSAEEPYASAYPAPKLGGSYVDAALAAGYSVGYYAPGGGGDALAYMRAVNLALVVGIGFQRQTVGSAVYSSFFASEYNPFGFSLAYEANIYGPEHDLNAPYSFSIELDKIWQDGLYYDDLTIIKNSAGSLDHFEYNGPVEARTQETLEFTHTIADPKIQISAQNRLIRPAFDIDPSNGSVTSQYFEQPRNDNT